MSEILQVIQPDVIAWTPAPLVVPSDLPPRDEALVTPVGFEHHLLPDDRAGHDISIDPSIIHEAVVAYQRKIDPQKEASLRPGEPTEWSPEALASFHQNGELRAAHYDVRAGQAPDGTPIEFVAFKPLPPTMADIADFHDLQVQRAQMGVGLGALWKGAGGTANRVINFIAPGASEKNKRPWKNAITWGLRGVVLLGGGCTAGQLVSPPVPSTLPPPGIETSMPTLTVAQETGAMIAQTTEGRAFYEALTAHGVDPSACSPDVLGNLVVEKNLPLGVVSDLTTIATDALANTPEPDHLKALVCDVEFYFSADTDLTGDGKPDIFIPSRAGVLLPGELIDGVPQVVAPAVDGQPPSGSLVTAPDWSPAGGEIPAEIRDLTIVEEQSIRSSLAEKNINTDGVLIHSVSRGSGDDFRMGSGVTNVDRTIAFYPQFDDEIDGFAWRPDLRLTDRPWHWEQVPLEVDGKIEVVFDPDSEAPQFVALTPDESRMTGWFNNITGQWLTVDGKELPPPTLIPEPTATPVEQLGGDKTSIVFAISYGSGFVYEIPPQVPPDALIPTTPDQWKALAMPTRADGTKVPWGELIRVKVRDGYLTIVMPVLIRDVIEFNDPALPGGTLILPVFELPAEGGSNFMIPVLQNNRYSTSPNRGIYTLKEGIPAQWQKGTTLDVPTYKAAVQSRGVNGAEFGAELRKHIGEVVLMIFGIDGVKGTSDDAREEALELMAQNKLSSASGRVNESGGGSGLILP